MFIYIYLKKTFIIKFINKQVQLKNNTNSLK